MSATLRHQHNSCSFFRTFLVFRTGYRAKSALTLPDWAHAIYATNSAPRVNREPSVKSNHESRPTPCESGHVLAGGGSKPR
jgi:hypothetical protein